MFQKISGNWYLTGLATSVSTAGNSTSGLEIPLAPGAVRTGLVGDSNYFVRTGSYGNQIAGIIPEPRSLFLLLAGVGFWFRRSR